ncbi:MAG: tetratricopeptide repeat protein [Alkalinema sp. CAN_BIN05]|nr:tetratricopeptide repeat protein [Alkalinema sp. CAN_BIN05]
MSESLIQKLLDDVAQAFDRKDYRSATIALKQLWQLQPENPQVQLYRGRLYEIAGNLTQADSTYKHLLKVLSTPKIMAQARQGLDRVALLDQEQRRREVALAISTPDQNQQGILILEAIEPTHRSNAALALAQIMNVDPYSARTHMPSRGWRIYRMGPIGEMKLYGQQLQAQGIPCFWIKSANFATPQLFQVQLVQAETPKVELVCVNSDRQTGAVSFDWSEVGQWVKGRLPILDRPLEFDPLRRQISARSRKEEVRDYALVLDLHLPARNCILRFCDQTYRFDQGVDFTPDIPLAQTVTRSQWNGTVEWITTELHARNTATLWDDFNAFRETAIEFPHLLKAIDPGFYLQGQENSRFNPTFHLYSLLAFCKKSMQ